MAGRHVIRVSLVVLALAAVGPCGTGGGDALAEDPPKPVYRDVDLVLVLDTSSSMQGLIDAARDKLSRVITSIATAKPEPNLRLALLTYGSPGASLSGDVDLRSNLTYNFDRVFDQLDGATVRGGHENVGRALSHTLDQLAWTPGSLRIVFVAGNESADQDRERNVVNVAREAARHGVRVNAIYCGGDDDGVSDTWRTLAREGNGRFANIDHNHGTVTVASPFDKELAALSRMLTRAYVLVGVPRPRTDAMAKADARVESLGLALAAERADAKASALFTPRGLEDDAAAKAHRMLRTKMRALCAKRRAHVAEVMKKRGLDDALAFDRVIHDALRVQLAAAGFEFQ